MTGNVTVTYCNNDDRAFRGIWVPAEIWLDKNLTLLEKAIFVEIDSLSKKPDGCYAGNKHFADMFDCSERKVSAAISKLMKIGYVEQVGFDGRTRFLRSCMRISFGADTSVPNDTEHSTQPHEICYAASRNVPPSNIYINTLNDTMSISKENSICDASQKQKRFTPPSVQEIREYVTEMDYPVDPERFFDYYESRGWMAGKTKMKDWKAAVRLWVRNRRESVAEKPAPQPQKKAPPAVAYRDPNNWWNGMTRDEFMDAVVPEYDKDGNVIGNRFPDGRFVAKPK